MQKTKSWYAKMINGVTLCSMGISLGIRASPYKNFLPRYAFKLPLDIRVWQIVGTSYNYLADHVVNDIFADLYLSLFFFSSWLFEFYLKAGIFSSHLRLQRNMAPIASTVTRPKTTLLVKETNVPRELNQAQMSKELQEREAISVRPVVGEVNIKKPAIDQQQSFELVQTLLLVSVS